MIPTPFSSARLRLRGRTPIFYLAAALLILAILLATRAPLRAQDPLEPAVPPDAHNGLPLYADRCANCHGPSGQGDGEMAERLAKPPQDYTDDKFRRTTVPSEMFETITDGRLEGGMPPFGSASSNPIVPADRWDLVAAIYSLATPPQSIESGRLIYEENCLACHGESGAGDGPEASQSTAELPDLTDLRYWYSRSNEMIFTSLQDMEIADHEYDLDENELWDVIDYSRTFSYLNADPEAEGQPIESVSIAGQVMNGSTDAPITAGSVDLRAFTPDLQEALSQTTTIGPDGRFTFELADVDPEWVFMASTEYGDLSFSSSPVRLERNDPQLEMPIVAFDTTDDPEAININQVHMIMDFADDKVQFSEIYVMSNLQPAVFIGETGNPDDGTFQFVLPAGAENVEFQRSFRSFENFLPATEVIPTEQGYADTVPVRPGDGAMNLFVSYELPFDDGMTVAHPVFYDTSNITIVVPDIGLEVEGENWTAQETQQMGDAGSIRSFSRPGLAAGEPITFQLQGRPQAAASVAGTASSSNDLTGILLGGAVLLLVAGSAAYTVQSWRSEVQEAEVDQADQVDNLLNVLAGLDEAYEAGSLEESVYQERRADTMTQLAAIWPAP